MAFSLLLTLLFYITHLLGYKFHVRHLHILSAGGFSIKSPTRSITIDNVKINFHIPRPISPYWITLDAKKYEYTDDKCRVSLEQLQAKIWFFPVFFRCTAGPWITVHMDGFRVQVYTSRKFPSWTAQLRDNVIYTFLNGETLRLHDINTKIDLSSLNPPEPSIPGETEEIPIDNEKGRDKEVAIRLSASQWHILNPRRRIYTFGDLEVDYSRNWTEGRGSLFIIAKHSQWNKLPSILSMDRYCQLPIPRQGLRGVWHFPARIYKLFSDPMLALNVEVSECQVTFSDFRIRDTEAFEQAISKLVKDYHTYTARHPEVVDRILADFLSGGRRGGNDEVDGVDNGLKQNEYTAGPNRAD
ncbi:hypothetical protein NLJ89_g3291 [Agrocybe chaxingu]|uniref:Uncharacterized protein n=1 Tax=Agrocybe chaxingu TaxID=84603 RepID=A0A9W8MYJ3_9AGAR|nr:hypothetical protein NLJ89_g3291 [Agrocybe chaxingu]